MQVEGGVVCVFEPDAVALRGVVGAIVRLVVVVLLLGKIKRVKAVVVLLRKRPSFLAFSLSLSRACLGKMIVLSIKSVEKTVSAAYACVELLNPHRVKPDVMRLNETPTFVIIRQCRC